MTGYIIKIPHCELYMQSWNIFGAHWTKDRDNAQVFHEDNKSEAGLIAEDFGGVLLARCEALDPC